MERLRFQGLEGPGEPPCPPYGKQKGPPGRTCVYQWAEVFRHRQGRQGALIRAQVQSLDLPQTPDVVAAWSVATGRGGDSYLSPGSSAIVFSRLFITRAWQKHL